MKQSNNIINLSDYLKRDKFNSNWDKICITDNLYQEHFPSSALNIIQAQKAQLKLREKYIKILSSIIYTIGGMFLFLIMGLVIKSIL